MGSGPGRGVAIVVAGVVLLLVAVRMAPAFFNERPAGEIGHAHGLAVDPTVRDVLWIGGHSGLVKVTAGRVWRQIGRQRYDMMGFVMSPAGGGTMFTSGHPGPHDRRPDPLGVEVSRDRGRTWRSLALAGQADFHALAVSTANPQVLYAWNVFGREGLYRSRDGGRSWTSLGAQGLGQVFALAAHPQRPEVVLAGTAGGLLVSENAGEIWTTRAGLGKVTITAVATHPRDPRVIYAYGVPPGPGLVRSFDGGVTWTSQGFFLGSADAVEAMAVDPEDADVLYLATFNGDLYRSPDGGRSREQWLVRGKILYER
ncbi:MAG: hypothetical protein QN152_08965 [Armatimonadota bacterium]|nr:hypothetical protein [Armatimonadota bacterium]MDR7426494.1 hypothetical protein [Armatimonadota bacterium]MDR7463391.1 hypothetical protein [Armatimonadota bacterium]MDR7468554.1 hypothetical protein [Armatimonadota bacterium]MDR7475147.1 hypothetical protein [Armatimonadota bacterium]